MGYKEYWQRFLQYLFTEPRLSNLSRAGRTSIAVAVPLLLNTVGLLPANIALGTIAAQNIVCVDVRGPYSLRLVLLNCLALIFTVAAWLGLLSGGNLTTALLGVTLMGLGAGVWRHLSSDYGPTAAIISALIYCVAAGLPRENLDIGGFVLSTLAGGLFGVLIQVCLWPFRAQHPLRSSVAESWQALANLFDAMKPDSTLSQDEQRERVINAETTLHDIINKTTLTLITAESSGLKSVAEPLEQLNLITARLAVRVVGFSTALESLISQPAYAALEPSFQAVLTSLANTARSVSVVVVSRQQSHVLHSEVRQQRLLNLLQALEARLLGYGDLSPHIGQILQIIRQIQSQVLTIGEALRANVGGEEERHAMPMELFELNTWTLRPLSATLNLRWRLSPTMLRYTARMTLLAILSMLIYKLGHFHYGYWLPMTIFILAQPDFGTTKKKTIQRIIGTLSAGLVAGIILHFDMHPNLLIICTIVSAFCFSYVLKQNYGIAVFFITLFVVFLIEAAAPNPMLITLERMGWTLLAAFMVLTSSYLFWPSWERKQFPAMMADALRCNANYWEQITKQLQHPDRAENPLGRCQQKTDNANNQAFISLQRMYGDPKNQRTGVELSATLANGNLRITRLLSLVSLHLSPHQPAITEPQLEQLAAVATLALNTLATKMDGYPIALQELELISRELERIQLPFLTSQELLRDPQLSYRHWVFDQLLRATTELGALLLSVRQTTPANEGKSIP